MSLLELKNITKSFGAIHALQGVDLSISPGEAVGLMGDNGAGKSTLMKIIAGNFPPTSGAINIEGRSVEFSKPIDAREAGIEIVYQELLSTFSIQRTCGSSFLSSPRTCQLQTTRRKD